MFNRRNLMLAGATVLLSRPALAQSAETAAAFPSRPIKIIVPLAPGGSSDVMARIIAEQMQNRLGQPVIVDNRPGAGSIIGIDMVAKAAPDGYTLGMGNLPALVLNPALQPDKVPYDAATAFAPVSNVGLTPNIFIVNPAKVAARTLKDFVGYLKANPDKLSYGSSGNGSALHIAMELFLANSGTKMTHVPYKGSSQMMTDLISGQIDAAMDAAATAMPHIKEGKLIALGVTTDTPVFFAPDIPPISAAVPGASLNGWHGIIAPAKTPPGIIAKLQDAIRAALTDETVQSRLKSQGIIPIGDTSAQFAAFIAEQRKSNSAIIAKAGIKID